MAKKLKFLIPEVREGSGIIWEDKIAGGSLRLSIIFLVMSLGLLGWWYKQLPPEVPLFFSRPWGKSQLVNPLGLWLLPGVSLIIMLVNSVLGALVFENHKLAGRMLMIAAVILNFMVTYSLIKILLLVI